MKLKWRELKTEKDREENRRYQRIRLRLRSLGMFRKKMPTLEELMNHVENEVKQAGWYKLGNTEMHCMMVNGEIRWYAGKIPIPLEAWKLWVKHWREGDQMPSKGKGWS